MNTSGTNWKAFKQLQKNLPNKLGWGCPSDWENSYYTTVFIKWRILAVNVAVYCETPVSDTYSTLSPDFLTIRVLNLVGLGFDTSEQPDHQAFAQKNYAKPDKEAAKKWLQPLGHTPAISPSGICTYQQWVVAISRETCQSGTYGMTFPKKQF